MSLLYSPFPSRKLILILLIFSITLLLAISLSQTVESAGSKMQSSTQSKGKGVRKSHEESPEKSRRFPNLDARVTEPEM
ncbi:MAG TPA: hypothetical protein VJT15_15155, partial [Pyrinomonadaceae bacterium]|nr:hypothetical protein [Pyrinomonadaceae bacterium]